ncbi:MAG TPA: hypothetical protein VND40_06025 [Nitrososphaerales archaeon]|nr:hypothetical protein [Nitrososphaerales archaeon]
MTIRIDFGRLFPGLVILLIGVALFILWLLLVFVSFFAFFIPGLGGIFYLALDILVASVVLVGLGALIMLAGVSGWWSRSSVTWGRHGSVSDRDRLMPGQRGGEVGSAFISFLILLFFIENQVKGTGFFTSRWGTTEQALFYGTWVVGALVSLARAAVGRRNPVRPLDALYGAMLAVTALWLLRVFPFDFAHFPDLLPAAVRPAFFWLTNPVGAIVLVLGAIGGFVSMVYNVVVYAVSRSRGLG